VRRLPLRTCPGESASGRVSQCQWVLTASRKRGGHWAQAEGEGDTELVDSWRKAETGVGSVQPCTITYPRDIARAIFPAIRSQPGHLSVWQYADHHCPCPCPCPLTNPRRHRRRRRNTAAFVLLRASWKRRVVWVRSADGAERALWVLSAGGGVVQNERERERE
jgi:hypothetical protein